MSRHAPLIQSMFHRRLALMLGLSLIPLLAIGAQLGRLTVLEHERLATVAESRLVRQRWLPTVRGRILDRTGRVLAYDRASYDVAVDYRVMTGEWAAKRARRAAWLTNRETWNGLDEDARAELIAPVLEHYERRVDEMWALLAEALGEEPDELAARRAAVVDRIGFMHERIASRRLENLFDDQLEAGQPTDQIDVDRLRSTAEQPIAEQRQAHVVAANVGDELGFRLLRLLDTETVVYRPDESRPGATPVREPLLPGVRVTHSTERVYPFDTMRVPVDTSSFPAPLRDAHSAQPLVTVEIRGVASPVLGRVRNGAFAEDASVRAARLEANPAFRSRATTDSGVDLGQYKDGDAVGHSGIESAQEHRLRGLRGLRTEHLDTGEIIEIEQSTGRDVRLALDARLQARIRAVMDPELGLARVQPWHQNESLAPGTSLYGAAAVVEVATGEIVALVSTPVEPRDGDWSTLGLQTPEQIALFRDLLHPEINKAIAKPYPPGSVAKAMILCGAERFGLYTSGETIPATGHLFPERPDVFRSWIFKDYGLTHHDQLGHDPDGVDALMVSANVFFYTLGRRLGGERLAEVYKSFGVGEGFGLGIGPEFPGKVGPFAGPGDGTDLNEWDSILLGIGQGPITWTPLHAASAYAALARGGVLVKPRIIRDGSAPEAQPIEVSNAALGDALEGLRRVINADTHPTGRWLSYGDSGYEREDIFNVPGITVRGKTGTATAPPLQVDPDGPDGPEPATVVLEGDHSWFVVLAGESGGPSRYAIAVVMDYAGSGGRVSGPIANQIVHALVAEGYLESPAQPGVALGSAP